MEFEIAQLRHMYAQMVNSGVKDSAAAKRIAEGLLSPVIESLERRHPERLSLCSEQIKVLEDARSIAMEFTSKARIPECGEFGKIAQDLDWLLSQLKNQKEMKKPMFWVRLRSDGGYEGPIHHDAIESVRKSCGDWHPLYLESVPKQRGCGMTTNNELIELRRLAETVLTTFAMDRALARNDFERAFHPERIIELLDTLDAQEKQIFALNGEIANKAKD